MSAAFDSARGALAAMHDGLLTSEKLVGDCLARIDAREDAIGAWTYLDPERALAEARACDDRDTGKPLAGLPVGVKDIFDTAGMPTAYGSPIHAGHRPSIDAAVVALIRRAGGVVMGKTVTTEFAMFTPGKTANPHNPEHTPGGSSSGSAAAVSDGMVPLALGTQTAGSIIRPASFCGVVGYKPTFDLICPVGMKNVAWTLDTVGVFARDVSDATLLAKTLSGCSLSAPGFSASRPPRLGLCRTPQWASADADARAAFAEAERRARESGASVVPVHLPSTFNALLDAHYTIMAYELARSLLFEWDTAAGMFSDKLGTIVQSGLIIEECDYAAAQRMCRQCRTELDDMFSEVDALITPSAPGEAPEKNAGTGEPVFNSIWTLLGTPCVNVPGLTGASGLPVGVQVIGACHDDPVALSVADWLHRLFD